MNNPQGFTLIEILIALTIFSILAVITTSVLYHTFDTESRVNAITERMDQLQLTIAIIQHSTEQIVPRAVRGNELHLFPAFIGLPTYVEFTFAGYNQLKRTAFLCRNHQLIRRLFKSLDTLSRHQFQDKVLLDNLDECQFAYLTNKQMFISEWMPPSNTDINEPLMPQALQIKLTLHDLGSMRFVWRLAPG